MKNFYKILSVVILIILSACNNYTPDESVENSNFSDLRPENYDGVVYPNSPYYQSKFATKSLNGQGDWETLNNTIAVR